MNIIYKFGTSQAMDIFKAIKKQDVEQIKSILSSRNIDIDVKKHGQTPLHLATATGNPNIMKILLHLGADVNIRSSDSQQKSSLHLACKYCCVEGVTLLLKSGADVNIEDHYGNSPLYKACSKGRLQIAKVLLQHGAQINATNNVNSSSLHAAACNGHKDIVKFLLESGCDKFIKNKHGDTAYSYSLKNKHADISKFILFFNYSEYQRSSKCYNIEEAVDCVDVNANTVTPLYEGKKSDLTIIDQKLLNLEGLKEEMNQVFAADKLQLKKAQECLNHAELRYKHTEEELLQLNGKISNLTIDRYSLSQEILRLNIENTPENVDKLGNDIHLYECPICFDIPLPPMHIYQCHQGHIYCEACKKVPSMETCPQCRESIAGLSIRCRHMEELIFKKFF